MNLLHWLTLVAVMSPVRQPVEPWPVTLCLQTGNLSTLITVRVLSVSVWPHIVPPSQLLLWRFVLQNVCVAIYCCPLSKYESGHLSYYVPSSLDSSVSVLCLGLLGGSVTETNNVHHEINLYCKCQLKRQKQPHRFSLCSMSSWPLRLLQDLLKERGRDVHRLS